jgi:hypothetical protein
MRIREPTTDRYGVLRVEDVGCWRIVDDDGFSEISSNLGKVFNVISLVVVTTFTEEAVVNDVVDI